MYVFRVTNGLAFKLKDSLKIQKRQFQVYCMSQGFPAKIKHGLELGPPPVVFLLLRY